MNMNTVLGVLIVLNSPLVLLSAEVTSASASAPVGKEAVIFHVAVDGNDRNKGTGDSPFASLERARDAIRALKRAGTLPAGGVAVELRRGTYQRGRAFELTSEDSGTADAPITYRAAAGESIRLLGGKVVTGFKAVTNQAVLERLDEAARPHVLQADLRAMRITEYGAVKAGGLELFFGDKPMTLARWPNDGFVKIGNLLGDKPIDVRGTKGDAVGKFIYEGDRPKRWTNEQEVWLHGYWFWDWADERQQVESIDTEKRIITLAKPYHRYGYRKGQWYYAFNLLAELDSPGEWYLDRKAGVLYFWPPAAIEKNEAVVSVLDTFIIAKNASHVNIRGMTLEACRGTAITISQGDSVRIVDCAIRNVGSWAVRAVGGVAHGVSGCDISFAGNGGVYLDGGDRKALKPGDMFADNNHIHDYGRWNRMYQQAVSLHGVGNRAAHNLIHDAPHEAIEFLGNDHVIEFNEIHHVCTEANDAGAIYSGCDWTMRGTIIRHNYLHHITGYRDRGCMGVYLDDMICGTKIVGNIFYKVTSAAFIGGGRDNVVENNIFVDCKPAVHVDGRALGWAKGSIKTDLKPRLLQMPYQEPPWSDRYPELVNILDDEPAAPRHNQISHNICVGGEWVDIEKGFDKLQDIHDNLIGEDAGLVAPEKGDFRLKDGSPALKAGFKPIPFDKIGMEKK